MPQGSVLALAHECTPCKVLRNQILRFDTKMTCESFENSLIVAVEMLRVPSSAARSLFSTAEGFVLGLPNRFIVLRVAVKKQTRTCTGDRPPMASLGRIFCERPDVLAVRIKRNIYRSIVEGF